MRKIDTRMQERAEFGILRFNKPSLASRTQFGQFSSPGRLSS